MARKRKTSTPSFTLTLSKFAEIWNRSLLRKLVSWVQDALKNDLGIEHTWVVCPPWKFSSSPSWKGVIIHLLVRFVHSVVEDIPGISLLSTVEWRIHVGLKEDDDTVSGIFLYLYADSQTLGKEGFVKQKHSEGQIMVEGISGVKSEEEFESLFLSRAEQLFNGRIKYITYRLRRYIYNWVVSLWRFYEKYGGWKVGDASYLRLFPLGFLRKREFPPDNEWQGIIALLRAPYFTLGFSLDFNVNRQSPLQPQLLPLSFKVGSRIGIGTPFITPRLVEMLYDAPAVGVVYSTQRGVSNPEEELSTPLDMLSKVEKYLLPEVNSLLQDVRKISEEPSQPPGRRYAVLFHSFLFAFFAVVSALLKSFGYEFSIQPSHINLSSRWEETEEGLQFDLEHKLEFTYKCRKGGASPQLNFRLYQQLGVTLERGRWQVKEPLWVMFRLDARDVWEAVHAGLPQGFAISDIVNQRQVAKEILLDFARRVREYLQKVSG